MSTTALKVGVAAPPFFTPFSSCYPAQLLDAIARAAGHDCLVDWGHIDFAARFIRSDDDYRFYKRLTHEESVADTCLLPLMQDFDPARHGPDVDEVANRLSIPKQLRQRVASEFAEQVTRSAAYLAGCDVVGITATHFQLVPALILAEALCRLPSPPAVVLGGYLADVGNAHALLETHPALSGVVYGEAEGAWLRALDSAHRGERRVHVGAAHRIGEYRVDYQSMMDVVARTPWIRRRFRVSLEMSRGCYWDRCDFCNFNAAYQGRFKTVHPAAMVEEMDRLHGAYEMTRFQFLDTALPVRFARHIARGAVRRQYNLFAEVRADFTRDDLAAMTQLGQVSLQIGVESLSNSHLAVMDKGATGAQNIQALKACRDLGIFPVWGLFVNHPKEDEHQLEELLRLTQEHRDLPPPKYVTECEIRPNSPLWHQRDELGVRIDFPWRAFDLILPPADEALEFLPYNIRIPSRTNRKQQLVAQIRQAAAEWWQQWHSRDHSLAPVVGDFA